MRQSGAEPTTAAQPGMKGEGRGLARGILSSKPEIHFPNIG